MSDPIQSFYGRYADLYDAIATAPGVARWRRTAADALDLSPGDTVVEMGCGTGANLPFLRERVGSRGTVLGVDLTRPLLERAQERVDRAGWENVAVVQADATRPPVACADAVLGSFVVGMLPDPAEAVRDWCALADGRVALLDGTSSDHPVGALANPLFGAFVGGGAPADGLSASVRQALQTRAAREGLDERVGTARATLASECVDRRYDEHALGFVSVVSGRPR
ncbi:class I SAM-dependent methyltransferase [Halomarina litorea]|uniref:class I SAM-dependent methyltransferase n=1 Tax=Halomarina litorea TaxID=2961595 RepID=UPI0020C2074A|nr:methyltransferase domain-containing protein [Halomarina sp. BCD28]